MFKYMYYFITIAATWGNDFQPTEILSGLIFANVKDVYLTSDEWNLVYYVNMKPFYEETDKIKLLIDTLDQMCNELIHKETATINHCELTIQHLKIHKKHIKNRIDLIRSFEPTRYKRAPVEIIGSVAKSLFGILDAESAKTYDGEINKLTKDANYQAELIKQQTSIIEATIASHRKFDLEVKNAIASLQAQIGSLKQTYDFEFNGLATATTLALLHHEEMAQSITKLLSNVLHGKVTDIIPPKQLEKSIKQIPHHLPANMELPINWETESIYHIFRVSSIHSTLTNDRIIVEMKIPIISNQPFKVIRALSIPIEHGTNYALIRPNHKIFITNTDTSSYIPFSEEALDQCISINNRTICSGTSPIVRKTHDICELELLNHLNLDKVPQFCMVEHIPRKNYIIKMFEENKYYLTVKNPYTIHSHCQGRQESIKISQSGILSLEPNCHVKSSEFSIQAHAALKSSTPIKINIPEMNLSQLLKTTDKVGMEQKTIIITDQTEDFRRLSESIKQQREKEETRSTLTGLSDRADTHLSLSCATIMVFTLVTALVIIQKYRKYRSARAPKKDEPDTIYAIPALNDKFASNDTKTNTAEGFELHIIKPDTKPRHAYR